MRKYKHLTEDEVNYYRKMSKERIKLEKDKLDLAREILAKAESLKRQILLPIDHIVVDNISPDAKTEIVGEDIPEGKIAVDIGPKTVALFKDKLKSSALLDLRNVLKLSPL